MGDFGKTTPDLATLRVWATQRNPNLPGQTHIFNAGCPFCDDSRHHTANVLLNEIDRLRAVLGEIASEDYRGNAQPSIAIARKALGEQHD